LYLHRRLLMLVDVGCCRVVRSVPNLYRGTAAGSAADRAMYRHVPSPGGLDDLPASWLAADVGVVRTTTVVFMSRPQRAKNLLAELSIRIVTVPLEPSAVLGGGVVMADDRISVVAIRNAIRPQHVAP
jgi:hypothetical protein